jgi:phosphoribosyl 1,2-cyclic phosphate phosphodiesterase
VDIAVVPIQVWHLKMPVLGFRFGNFTYITDANRVDAAERKKISGSTTIVINALRKEKHISHFNLAEAITFVQELGVPRAYFTHISHQLGKHEGVAKDLPGGMEQAYDELEISVDG